MASGQSDKRPVEPCAPPRRKGCPSLFQGCWQGNSSTNLQSIGGHLESVVLGMRRHAFSGHPRIEKGHSPDENQVSRTSSSCSSSKFFPLAITLARSVASSAVRPTTQYFPSLVCKCDRWELCGTDHRNTNVVLFAFNANEISWASVTPPQLSRYTPVLYVLKPSVPLSFALLGANRKLACPRTL